MKFPCFLICWIAILCCAPAQSVQSLQQLAGKAAEKENYAEAASLYRKIAALESRSSGQAEALFQAARFYALSGQSEPAFYRAIRPVTYQIPAVEKGIRQVLRRMCRLYPETRFPDIYFLIGCWSAAGTISENGILLPAIGR